MFNKPQRTHRRASGLPQARTLRKQRGFYEFFGIAIVGKISVTIYSLLGVGLVSCGGLSPYTMNKIDLIAGVNVVNIRALTSKQNKEATVYLRGKVIRQVPLVDWRVYQLQDATGSIWVLTKNTNIRPKELLIKGKVRHQSIPIAGKDFGEVYLEEE